MDSALNASKAVAILSTSWQARVIFWTNSYYCRPLWDLKMEISNYKLRINGIWGKNKFCSNAGQPTASLFGLDEDDQNLSRCLWSTMNWYWKRWIGINFFLTFIFLMHLFQKFPPTSASYFQSYFAKSWCVSSSFLWCCCCNLKEISMDRAICPYHNHVSLCFDAHYMNIFYKGICRPSKKLQGCALCQHCWSDQNPKSRHGL